VQLAGSYTGDTFALQADATGGTAVSLALPGAALQAELAADAMLDRTGRVSSYHPFSAYRPAGAAPGPSAVRWPALAADGLHAAGARDGEIMIHPLPL
jgi:hypothetical protein